jgi:bla regulator protein BlaR1
MFQGARQVNRVAASGVGIVAVLVLAAITCPFVRAQSVGAPDWQAAAGGKMAFETASVKLDSAGGQPRHDAETSTISLNPQGDNLPTDGLLQATDWPLFAYIAFAYKLTPEQTRELRPELPAWSTTSSFDISGRASGSPTRDQVRLMMQALLADRFKMTVHRESRQVAVYALIPDKPRKVAAGLHAHVDDPACSVAGARCPRFQVSSAGGKMKLVARGVTMAEFALNFPSFSQMDRFVVDKTAMAGSFDFELDYEQPSVVGSDDAAPSFVEALKDQLGLKLETATNAVNVLVVDHIEMPSAN